MGFFLYFFTYFFLHPLLGVFLYFFGYYSMNFVFYCPYVPVVTKGELWVTRCYRTTQDQLAVEYLVVLRCCISEIEEILEEVFPTPIFGHDAPVYEKLSDLIIT